MQSERETIRIIFYYLKKKQILGYRTVESAPSVPLKFQYRGSLERTLEKYMLADKDGK